VAITDDHDERALIEAAQADPARFVDLYERHFHRVYAYVIRRMGSRAEAEDITSDNSSRLSGACRSAGATLRRFSRPVPHGTARMESHERERLLTCAPIPPAMPGLGQRPSPDAREDSSPARPR
jgi:hypothetical protein